MLNYNRLRNCLSSLRILFVAFSTFAVLTSCGMGEYNQNNKDGHDTKIIIQASSGSFNDEAFTAYNTNNRSYEFSEGTPEDTFNKVENTGSVFVALENSLVSGRIILGTARAIQNYEVLKVVGTIRINIKMCLVRLKGTELNPLKIIASYPAAFEQIKTWIKSYEEDNNTELLTLVTRSTEQGAKLISQQKQIIYKDAIGKDQKISTANAGAIGSKKLATKFTNLTVVESNIQSSKNNSTLFGELEIKQRETSISLEQAQKQLLDLIKQNDAEVTSIQ